MSSDKDKPFSDLELENKFLRILIANGEKDKENYNEISRNVSMTATSYITKEYFNSPFRQWLFQKVLDHYFEHSDILTYSVILNSMGKTYRKQSIFDSKKIVIDKIFEIDFEPKIFKVLLKTLKNKYDYNVMFETLKETSDDLEEHFNSDEENAIEIARKIEDVTSRIIMSNDNIRIIDEDVFENKDQYFDITKDRMEHPEKYRGITTGFPEFDQATGGWINGELSLILGRPGMGKSILLTNFAYTAFMKNFNVMYITIEMPFEQQRNRFYSRLTGIDYTKLKFPTNLQSSEFDYLKKRINEEFEKHNNFFKIIDAPENCTSAFLESKIIEFQNNKGQSIDLLLVDPLYLMRSSDKKSDDPIGQISIDLKILARKLDIPVLGASQFNRESHKRHTKTGSPISDAMDAAFSDKLGQNSDNMIGILGPLPKIDPRADLQFPKTRDADISVVHVRRRFEVMKFEIDNEERDKNWAKVKSLDKEKK